MALTKITPQMFDTSAAGHDFNIDNGTFVVDASANRVGIGTATPSTLLDVNGVLTATSIAGTLTTAAQTNITSVGTLGALTISGDLTVDTNTLKVDSSNNRVGIGITSPDEILHIKGDGARIYVDSTDYNLFSIGRRGSSGADLDKAYLRMKNAGTNTIVLDTAGDSYFNGGNVGIGTTSPTAKKSSTTLQVNGNVAVGDNNAKGIVAFGDIASADVNVGLHRGASGVYSNTAGNSLNIGAYDAVVFTTGNADIASQTERMRIDSSGVVGIAEGGVRYASRFSVGKPLGSTPGSAFTSSPSSFFSEATLGGTTGNSQKIVTFAGADTTNVSGLSIYRYRRATGTNWTTDGFSLRQEVDNSASIYDYMNFAAGNIGIGTPTPQKKLHIFDSTQTNQSVRFGNPAAAPYGEINYNSTGFEHLYIDSHGTTTGYGNIVFRTGATPDTRMFIHANGNIGAGTSDPKTPFQIAGNSTNAFFFHPAYQSIGNNLYYNGSAWAALNTSIGGSVLQLGAGNFAIRRSTAANPPVLSYTIYSDSSGNVALNGILDPTEPFEVYGSINSRYQSNNFAAGAQRAFMDIINSSKIVRIGSLTGAATPTGSQGGVDIVVNNSGRARFDVNGNLAVGSHGNTPTLTHKTNAAITASQSTGNSWSATSGESGTYSNRGAIEVAGIYNKHFYKWAFTGNLSAQTWYPFAKRSELTTAVNQTGSGSEDGFAMYFRIYTYLSTVGVAEYGSNRLSNMIWINNFGSNSNQIHYFNIGPGFGHAPNTGDSSYGNAGQFRLRVQHRYGSDSTFPADQTFEFYSNSALTGLNPAVAGRQILIYGYLL